MSINDIRLVVGIPTVEVYQQMRRAVGWEMIDDVSARRGLEQSLNSVCAMDGKEVVGVGRIVGDGGICFYIQDVIVLPEYQGQGVGTKIMKALMAVVRRTAHPNAFVALLAVDHRASFYERFGFEVRPPVRPGMQWAHPDNDQPGQPAKPARPAETDQAPPRL